MEDGLNNISLEQTEKALKFFASSSSDAKTEETLSEARDIIRDLLSVQSKLETKNNELRTTVETFKEEQKLYKTIFDSQPAGSYRIKVLSIDKWNGRHWTSSKNPPYTVEFVSDKFAEILGLAKKNFKNNIFILSDLIYKDDIESFANANEIANRKFHPFRWEGRVVVNKKIRWIRLESVPQKNVDGSSYWTGVLYDITERKRTEEELSKTRIQLEDVLNGANVGTLEWNIQTGKIKFNDIWAKNLGYTPIELKMGSLLLGSKGWKALTHPDDIAYADEMLRRHISGELPYHSVEVRMRHRKGHWVWVRQVGKVKTWTKNGKPLLMYGIHTNIDDRKKSEIELANLNNELEKRVKMRTSELEKLNSELLKSEQKFKTISDFTYDWEYWKGVDNQIIFMSPSVLRITGYSINEFVENPNLLNEIVYTNDLGVWNNHVTHRMEDSKEGDSIELIFRILTKKGDVRWIGHVCRSIYIDGKYLGVRVSNRDITEKVNAEKELLAVTVNVEERERNRFSSELHDGMGPLLSTIKLYFQWLSENDDEQKKLLITEKGNQCIEAAIQTARELSRGLSSQLLLKSGYVFAIEDFIKRINETGKIHVNFTADTNTRFDNFLEITLYRITTELLKNTLTYANASIVMIDFRFDLPQKKINLKYNDDGVGFDYKKIKDMNTGLGLMNIQQRVQVLKGKVSIDSEQGKGMMAHFQFPVENDVNPDLAIMH